ncbi:MAG: hypothetical protein HY301_10850, partial [Verrucomicrobia bacterium]|nr:hypothetical protein [Verrucomicrobiota bacterium]
MRLPALLLLPFLAVPLLGATATNELKIEPTKISLAGPIRPGPRDADIARLVARVLEKNHYSQMPFDKEVSAKFLDRYVETWDPQRLHFLESDLKEFEVFRDKLDFLTMEKGDTQPANLIYMRFRDRLRERVAYVNEILPKEKLDFTTDEKILLNRKDAPRPKTLDEAKQLWRERLRYELLQEKLNKKKPAEMLEIISHRYARMHRYTEELDGDDVLQAYLTALAHIYDPHSDYFNK